jgi:predicted DNA-binding antitoxin AbrB/MazE fold protein
MTQFVQAIFEQGVFRPLEPVRLAEREQVTLVVTEAGAAASKPEAAADDATIQRQREALAALRAKMDSLPDRAPQDGLGGADHDLILYGWQK